MLETNKSKPLNAMALTPFLDLLDLLLDEEPFVLSLEAPPFDEDLSLLLSLPLSGFEPLPVLSFSWQLTFAKKANKNSATQNPRFIKGTLYNLFILFKINFPFLSLLIFVLFCKIEANSNVCLHQNKTILIKPWN